MSTFFLVLFNDKDNWNNEHYYQCFFRPHAKI